MPKKKTEREIVEELQRKADNQRPMRVDFQGQPGPFELPKCGPHVSVGVGAGDTFVLELETAEQSQLIRIPISVEALSGLESMILHMRQNYGLDQKKH
ncbi:hypothetical protein [Aquibium oceanicum]|uniref:Uncharacterized protein n=1 Tax=Aquibium oceanicum TaxID=1670800 RepID=A0A1L3SXI8_9HYPH|nr:hypothetical protein [Aquibium oceanicum]APH74118.1 hypothetical protein BSQ44_24175 [Aquibium oceanicum]